LYGQVWQVDAEPTSSQAAAVAATEHDAQDVMQRWDALRTVDLPALNHALTGASLPEVKIDTDQHQEDGGMDEE
jgi:UDP-3-O-[3-hydroxymyristoyl] glucosamine N-acyltransferase